MKYSPEEIEQLYREDPSGFDSWLDNARSSGTSQDIVKVWDARINYVAQPAAFKSKAPISYVILISIYSWILVKLPALTEIEGNWYYPRFIPIIIFSALIIYFCLKANKSNINSIMIAGIGICTVIALLFPDNQKSASLLMSQIHMPLVLLSLLSISFMESKWNEATQRLRYIRYFGDMIIYAILVLIGGIVLTALTLGLFSLIGLSIGEWYMSNVVVLGLVASPIVATYLYDSVLGQESKLATVISNVFAPLFLVTVVIYLIAVLYQGKSPYSDRDFLIMFNGLLIVVWAIAVFSISGRSDSIKTNLTDSINIALLTVTLIINTIALSAIVFRLSEYGITPNRVAVTGANILIFLHLIFILKEYLKYTNRKSSQAQLAEVVANYLPVYSAWSLFVVCLLPLLFWFE
ncbi:MAG: DUF4153 domain-containing protein [Gammaproteobacteria bacterium]|nr:DUF4153 domain-containing protein [Gammaproteobacteria bacterium]